ncbi:hypothetical protein CMI37_29540 [Candidatus Pacearchaeota archaeon]|nr:hypothetical protein [Candidatus Pacearchaeota archaeon]
MVLGIDISTSLTGFAIMGDGQLLHHSAVDLRKQKGPFKKAIALREHLEDFFEAYQCNNDGGWGASKYPIEHIYIEQPLHMFMRGKSSAKTLSTLMTFNGIVSWIIYELFEIEPQYIAATSARKQCGIKVKRGEKAKEIVLKHLLDNEPAFHIDYTKYGNPVAGSYDKADAIVVAKAGFLIEQEEEDE